MSIESPVEQSTREASQGQLKLNPPLFKLKILDALKNNSIDQLKTLVGSVETKINAYELEQVKSLILNLAVQVAPAKLITKLLSEEYSKDFGIDINEQDSDGNTPLHLVALNNRIDVAQLLLRDPRINDTILNNDLKQPIDLTKDLNMVSLMQHERGTYIEKIAIEFKQAFLNHDMATLDEILAVPRNYELLDINGYDPETGETVLHEFIKKNDIGMVKWILTHGGDPFKRDRKGKLPLELVAKQNETMRQILKEASQEQSVIDTNAGRIGGITAPTYKGYLRKWTNFASGYKLRWFVLDSNGILSYYKSQEDTNNACRGSLNMKSALLHLDSSEKLKFEIIGASGSRWHLKSNHPIETNRWVWSLQGAIRYSKDKEKATKIAQKQATTGRISLDQRNLLGANYSTLSRRNSSSSLHSSFSNSSYPISHYSKIEKTKDGKPIVDNPHIVQDSDFEEDDDYEYDDSRELEDINETAGPFSQEISVLRSRFSIELSSLKDLLELLQKSGVSDETLDISLKSVNSLINGFSNYNDLVGKRDEKLIKNLNKQRDINELWINSIRDLENELLVKNEELEVFERERKKIKKALNRKQSLSAPLVTTMFEDSGAVSKSVEEYPAPVALTVESEKGETKVIAEASYATKTETSLAPLVNDPDDEISRILQEDEDSDDEFFDADEFSDTEEEITHEEPKGVDIPEVILEVPEPPEEVKGDDEKTLISTAESKAEGPGEEVPRLTNELQRQKLELLVKEGSFLGYEDPIRTELPLKVDNRPKISLWGILKSMIGKDITKISLPVTFNEPTSMLQRIAEDLEYSSLLDEAASFEDSTKRLLYVAAFAASEYSSTLGRVAKPFNPLLGETYEYSRPDLGFRYFTEQVSHHPPVNAALTESTKWDYYGETSVKAGFNGRSFDARPLGGWFLHLRPDSENHEEIYTWKKITSSVGGIMLGNPQIDNYGEMEIINHNTGDKCIVNFKQKGWRGSSAHELSGVVTDSKGKKHWAIGGHWSSKIYGKKVTGKETTNIRDDTSGTRFVIWQQSPRPEVPFHLTQYAISLNAPQPKLIPWLSKSDTRLRPDQRAMEDGRYDDASKLKNDVEEKQRAARKARERDGVEYKPNFFKRSIHPLTGKEYWKFTGDYWSLRKDHKLPEIDIFV